MARKRRWYVVYVTSTTETLTKYRVLASSKAEAHSNALDPQSGRIEVGFRRGDDNVQRVHVERESTTDS